MAKNITIKDIAREAGVSIALVSFVMNNRVEADGKQKYRVGEATKERILEVARRMNYKPSSAARMLRQGRTRVIGVIVSDLGNIFFGIIAKEIEKIITRNGYTVLFGSSDEDPERFDRLVRSFLEKDVEGFIVVPCLECGPSLEKIRAAGRPFVTIDRRNPLYDVPAVLIDNEGAAKTAVDALRKQGATRIGMLSYAMRISTMIERERGFREAAGAQAPIYLLGFHSMQEDTERAAEKLLAAGIDGMVCASNEASVCLIKALHRRGIEIQKDVRIVGFDYSNVYDIFTPRISHMLQPLPRIAQESTQILFRLIEKKEQGNDISLENEKIILNATLI